MSNSATSRGDTEGMDYVDLSVPGNMPAVMSIDHKGKTPWIDENAPGEKLTWLYGRKPDSVDSEGYAEWSFELFMEVSTSGGMVYDLDGREHSPDDAVEYARALLAAAEVARRHTD